MVILPILNKDKIYNVEVKLKNVIEDSELGLFEKHYESDIVINGQSYNESTYHEKNAPLINLSYFIRNSSLYTGSYVLTSRRNDQGKMHTYRIAMPPLKISDGLDSLYSSVIQNMKKEIPEHEKGKYISLKSLGVFDHLKERPAFLFNEGFLNKEQQLEKEKFTQLLTKTCSFLQIFDCRVIEDAILDVKTLDTSMQPFVLMKTEEGKKLQKYYNLAEENASEYRELQSLVRNLMGETFHWIRQEKQPVKKKNFEGKYD